MTAQELASRLNGRPCGSGWAVRCPAHDDHRASLSINEAENGTVLVHCHAGCGVSAVLAAAGLTFADLRGPERNVPPRRVVGRYDYADESGVVLYQVVRFDPKDFRQRRPDRSGGWTWNTAGVRRVLYRLRELRGHPTAYVVEGEKDVETLWSVGLPATCNVGGAGKWRDEYAQQLRAAGVQRVAILPDNDAPGRTHAEAVARSCHAAGLTVQLVTLPGVLDGGDVSDYLRAHTREDLAALVREAAGRQPAAHAAEAGLALTTIGDLLAEADEGDDWLVEGLIQRGSTSVLAAKPKVGKSTLARALTRCVARGEAFLGRTSQRGTVWYLAFEGRRRDIREHFRQLGLTAADPVKVFVGAAPADVVTKVREQAASERPDLIVIDTMQRFLRAKSMDDYAEWTLLLDEVITTAQESGAALMLLTHNGKADREGLDAILGSTAIAGSVDTAILLTRNARYRTIRTVQRTGQDLDERVIVLDEQTGLVELAGTREEADGEALVRQFAEALAVAGEPLTRSELLDRVEGRRAAKLAALKVLTRGNSGTSTVLRTGAGTKNDPHRYSITEADSGSGFPSKGGNPNHNTTRPEDPRSEPAQDCGSRFLAAMSRDKPHARGELATEGDDGERF